MNLKLLTFDQSNLKNSLNFLDQIYNEEKNRSVYNLIRDINNNNFSGWVSILFDNDELISCAALETSEKYTGDVISLRFCRYYKLKSKRKIQYNFYNYLEEYYKIAKRNNFSIIYFTVFNPKVYKDIQKSKSQMIYKKYQKKISITDFKLRDDILFKINDNCVQYIFEYKFREKISWSPTGKYIISKKLYSDNDIEQIYKLSMKKGLV